VGFDQFVCGDYGGACEGRGGGWRAHGGGLTVVEDCILGAGGGLSIRGPVTGGFAVFC